MKLDELEQALAIQKKAYGLLLWLKQHARTKPEWFDSQHRAPFDSGDTCSEWVRCHYGSFPSEFRPTADEMHGFGFVLSSFFSTSFRIADIRSWDGVETKLVPGSIAFRDRRHKRHAEQRQQTAAEELRKLALLALAEEFGQTANADLVNETIASLEIANDLALWTYACELVRRCQFASQGPAVHRLWLEIDEKFRKNLSADTIWNARSRLVQWLTKHQFKQKESV